MEKGSLKKCSGKNFADILPDNCKTGGNSKH